MIHPNADGQKITRDDFHVLTGASGGGKSSIIRALRVAGFHCVDEVGREVVQAQRHNGGDATPWQDRRAFRDLLFARSVAAFARAAAISGPVIFDRGIVEAVAYSRLLQLPVPDEWLAVIQRCRYASVVFVAPPWREIFRTDAERRKSWGEVLRDYRFTVEAYAAAGYDMVELPRGSAAERAAFVLSQAGLDHAAGSRNR